MPQEKRKKNKQKIVVKKHAAPKGKSGKTIPKKVCRNSKAHTVKAKPKVVAKKAPLKLKVPPHTISTTQLFSEAFGKARAASGMSQMALAKLCAMNASAISHLEIGRNAPSLDSFRRICVVLKLDANKVLQLSN